MRIRLNLRGGLGVGVVVGALGTSLAACAVAPASNPYPDVASFCNAKAAAECQIAATCGNDASGCKVERASLCNVDAAQATADGLRQYVSASAQSCITAVSSAYGGGATSISYANLYGPGSITDKCERVFSGNIPQANTCKNSYDCAGSAICAPEAVGSSTLICANESLVAEGDLCGQAGQTCASDSFCAAQSSGASKCQPGLQDGQPCSATMPCISTERCAMNSGVTGQTCVPRVAASGSCASDADCPPAAPYCDPNAGSICTAGLSFATKSPDCNAFGAGGIPSEDAGSSADATTEAMTAGGDAGSDAGSDAGDSSRD
ncbi:MAG: hypothetical protein ACREJ3_15870 [Polyangiaceae bacterium]